MTAMAKIIFSARKAACFALILTLPSPKEAAGTLLAEQDDVYPPPQDFKQGVPGRDNIPDVEGRCAATFIGMADSDGDLEISGSLLQQTCEHVRLEAESVSIGMPAKDIVA